MKKSFKIITLIMAIFGVFVATTTSTYANAPGVRLLDVDGEEFIITSGNYVIKAGQMDDFYVYDPLDLSESLFYASDDGLWIEVNTLALLRDINNNEYNASVGNYVVRVTTNGLEFKERNSNTTLFTSTHDGLWISVEENLVPVITGETAFVTNVDNPMSETEIRSHIVAWDETDGDITHLIEKVSDTYTPNMNILGTYEIVYEVSDSNNNTSSLTVTVLVKDVVAPSYNDEALEVEIGYSKTFDVEAHKTTLNASDNYYDTSELTITIKSNTYTSNKTKLGTYEVVYEIKDPSNNATTVTVNVTVYDDVDPTISGPTLITKQSSAVMTLNDIKAQFTANDVIDGNITNKIEVLSDNYTGKGSIVGSYDITFRVIDNAGNFALHTVTIQVTDSIPPVFFVRDGYFISVSDSLSLTLEDIIHILEVTGQINMPRPFMMRKVLIDEYTDNQDVPGIYAMSFVIAKDDGQESTHNVAIQVLETEESGVELPDNTEKTLTDKIKTWFNDKIWNPTSDFVKENLALVIIGAVVLLSIVVTLIVIGVNKKPTIHIYKTARKKNKRWK